MTSKAYCPSCKLNVREKQQKLTCCQCCVVFHRTCIEGFSQEKFRKMKKNGQLELWKCKTCVGSPDELGFLMMDQSLIEISDNEEEPQVQPTKIPKGPSGPIKFDFVTSTSLTLSWGKSIDDNDLDGIYHIGVTKTEGDDWSSSLTSQENSCKVIGLRPNTDYLVCMFFENSNGQSYPIKGTIKTKPAKLQGPIGPIKFDIVTSTSLTMSWGKSPDDIDANGLYHIKVTKAKGDAWSSTVTSQVNGHRVFDLSPKTEYVVHLYFETIYGKSEPINGTVKTKPAKLQCPTGPLKFDIVSSTSLTLSWGKSLDDNGVQSLYGVYHVKVTKAEDDTSSSAHYSQTNSFVVTDLSPKTDYTVLVLYENANGHSDSIIGTIRTKPAKLKPPSHPIRFHKITSTSFTLSWGQSPDDNGKDNGIYQIRLAKQGDEAWSSTIYSRDKSCEVTDLSPKTKYEVNLLFENAYGLSDPVYNVVKTPSDKPKGPTGPIKFDFVTSSSLTLSWGKSLEDKGTDRVYRIKVTKTEDDASSSTITSRENSCYIVDLKPNTDYVVHVFFENIDGQSDPIVNFVKTKPAPGPLTGPIKLDIITTTSVTLSWGKSLDDDGTDPAGTYHVKLTKQEGGDKWSSTITSKQNRFTFVGLRPNTVYGVNVYFESSKGKSKSFFCPFNTKQEAGLEMPEIPMYEVAEVLLKPQLIGTQTFRKTFTLSPAYFGDKRIDKDHEARVQIRFGHKDKSKTKTTKIKNLPATVSWNGALIKSQVEDLTGKPSLCWSVPLDVTSGSRLHPKENILLISPNTKELQVNNMCMSVRVVKVIPVEELCEKLMISKLQPSEITTNLIKAKFADSGDSEIATTSVRASLRCPVGRTRMKYPCRGSQCKHIQCADALSIMSLNRTKPEFTCHACSQTCCYDDLIIDELFLEILASVPDSVEEVEFREDGSWTYKGDKSMEVDKENDMSVIELDLSHALETIDLTETDDEATPWKQTTGIKRSKSPAETNLNKKERQPLKTNTVIANTTTSDIHRLRFGENYLNSNTSRYQRNNSSNRSKRQSVRSRPPWTSSHRKHWQPYCTTRTVHIEDNRYNRHVRYDDNGYYQPHTAGRTFSTIFDALNRITWD